MAFFTEFLPMSEECTTFDCSQVSAEDVAYAKSFWQSIQLNPPVESTLSTQKVSQRVKTNKSNASTHNTAITATAASIKSHSLVHASPLDAGGAVGIMAPRFDENGIALPNKLVEFYARVQKQTDQDKKLQRQKWLSMKEQQTAHMATLMQRREAQRHYINDSKSAPPLDDVVKARLNELPPELEEADWSDDVDGSKDDIIDSVRNLPS